MPIAKFQMPDGRVAKFDVPEGTTPEQAQSFMEQHFSEHEKWDDEIPSKSAPKDTSALGRMMDKSGVISSTTDQSPLTSMLGKSLSSIPAAGANLISSFGSVLAHPIDTISSAGDVLAGGLRKIVPNSISQAIDSIDNPVNTQRIDKAANAFGQYQKDRYGSLAAIKNTLETDPVGMLADISTLLSGGAGALGAIPKASKVAEALRTGAQYTNPINAIIPAVKGAGKLTGNIAAHLMGDFGTRTGAESIKQAASAGFEGGNSSQTILDNMRGKVPISDVLDMAKQNIEEMGRQKSRDYRAGMAEVSGDKSVLDFAGIDDAVKKAYDVSNFKGQVKNQRAAQTQQAIAKEIDDWKRLNPSEFHTPEGLDALKQKIGGIVESIPFEEKTARMVGKNMYNAIKDEIVGQAPVYSKVMKDYATASDEIKEIERTLSLGKSASIDAAMRKLQSITRNNVNTNYGNRVKLVKDLETKGGNPLMPALAGQALSSWAPRGIGNAVAGGLGFLGYGAGGYPGAIGTLAVQSPRLMGEAAVKAGQAARMLRDVGAKPINALGSLGIDPKALINFLSQFTKANGVD